MTPNRPQRSGLDLCSDVLKLTDPRSQEHRRVSVSRLAPVKHRDFRSYGQSRALSAARGAHRCRCLRNKSIMSGELIEPEWSVIPLRLQTTSLFSRQFSILKYCFALLNRVAPQKLNPVPRSAENSRQRAMSGLALSLVVLLIFSITCLLSEPTQVSKVLRARQLLPQRCGQNRAFISILNPGDLGLLWYPSTYESSESDCSVYSGR